MIDLTPLDIRKKKGDFRRGVRGYHAPEVDHFLDLVAERLEELVRENLTLKERVDRLGEQVRGQEGRERAVQEALVTAQSLREEIQAQARREEASILREAETAARAVQEEAEAAARAVHDGVERTLQERRRELHELNRARARFLMAFRTLLEREIDTVQVAESAPPPDDFELGGRTVAPSAGDGAQPEAPVPLDSLLEDDPAPPGSSGDGTLDTEIEAEFEAGFDPAVAEPPPDSGEGYGSEERAEEIREGDRSREW